MVEDTHAAKESEEPLIHDLISDAMQEDTPPRHAPSLMLRSDERLDKMSSSSRSDTVDTTVITFSSDSEGEREGTHIFARVPNSRQHVLKEHRKRRPIMEKWKLRKTIASSSLPLQLEW